MMDNLWIAVHKYEMEIKLILHIYNQTKEPPPNNPPKQTNSVFYL